jgi:hypothetical protein
VERTRPRPGPPACRREGRAIHASRPWLTRVEGNFDTRLELCAASTLIAACPAAPQRSPTDRTGIRHLVSGIRHLVSGIWYLVSGIWYLASGIRHLVSGIWYLASGIWHQARASGIR